MSHSNTTTINNPTKKAKIFNTTLETVEKVQICIFANFKDSQIK
jgi:hypothetical protein